MGEVKVVEGGISGLLALPALRRMSARTDGDGIRLMFPFLLKNLLTAAVALVAAVVFTAVLGALQGWLPFLVTSGSERSMVFAQVVVGLAAMVSFYAFLSKAFGRIHYIADPESLTVVLRILGVTLRRKSVRWSAIAAIRTVQRDRRNTDSRAREGKAVLHVQEIETADGMLDRHSTRLPSVARVFGVVDDALVSVARFYGFELDAK